MKDRELILRGPEGQLIEFKRTVSSSLSREISAFANTGGGTIVIGVNDNGVIIGMNDLNEDQSKIMSHARNCDPPVHIDAITYRTRTGQDVIFVEIPDSSDRPHSCSEGFFLRSGASTQKMTRDEIIGFLHSENHIRWDEKDCPKFRYPDDFDEAAFARFRRKSLMFDIDIKPEDLLFNLVVARRTNNGLIFNNAGVMFFAKEPTRFHSDAYVDCILFQGYDKVTILDRKIHKGNLMDNVEQAMVFLKKHLSLRYEIKSLVRKEILELPEDALREAVLNAVIHRDYHFDGANISIEIYRDRVEISDPGTLPPGMKPEDLGTKSVRRNKLLADLFHRLGEVEKVGSGILRIEQTLKEAKVPPMRSRFTGFCTFIFDRIIPQDTPQVTPQVTPQDKMLFILYDKELSRDEIMEVIDLKDRKHFREIYLNPAIRSGFIEMTIPDKPNSPNQKYRLTSKGRSYLSKIEGI